MKLRLSEDYVIDTNDYRKEGLRIAILAMSGHGKSNADADVIEDVLDRNRAIHRFPFFNSAHYFVNSLLMCRHINHHIKFMTVAFYPSCDVGLAMIIAC